MVASASLVGFPSVSKPSKQKPWCRKSREGPLGHGPLAIQHAVSAHAATYCALTPKILTLCSAGTLETTTTTMTTRFRNSGCRR